MDNEQVYSVEIETGDINKRLDEIRASLEANASQIKAYQDQVKAGNRLTNEQARELLRLRDTQKTLGREQQVLTQITTAQTGSLDQQRKQLIAARLQWDRLSVEQRNNSKEGQALKRQIDELNASVSGAEQSTGRFQRGVGNYANQIREALSGTKAFGKGFEGVNKVMGANPIFLVVTALASLTSAVSKAQFIVDAFAKVWEPVNAVIQSTVGLFQNAVAAIRDGTFSLRGFFKEAQQTYSGAIEAGSQLAALRVKIEEQQNRLILKEAELKNEFEAQRAIAADVTKSQQERTKAAEAAIKAVEQQFEEQKTLLDLQIAEASLRASLNDTDRKTQGELLKLQAQRNGLQGEFLARTTEVRNQLNGIFKSEQDAAKKRQEDAVKQQEETNAAAIALAEKRAQEFAKLSKAELDLQLKTTQEFYAQIERARKEQLAADLVAVAGNAEEEKRVRQQAEADLTQLKFDSLKTQETILNDYALTVEGIDEMITANSIEQSKLASDAKIALLTSEYEKRKELAEKQAKEDEAFAQRQQQAFITASQQIGQQLESSLASYKGDLAGFTSTIAAGVLKTTLDVIKNQMIASQVAAVAQVTGQAVVNPALLFALAGRIALISAAFGAAKVGIDRLFTVAPPKFEDGGYISGPRHSAGGVLIEAEGGEFIMNRGAVAAFGPQIEMMNAIGRGAAPSAPILPGINDGFGAMAAMIENIRPEVSVKEIQRVSSRVNVRESNRSW